jgi:arsenite methyltransferase
MAETSVDLRRHNADYGFDGSYHHIPAAAQVAVVVSVSSALLASAALSLSKGRPVAAALNGFFAASILATTAAFIRTTRVGKFVVWDEILRDLHLRGDETVLDLGCGRGAVLLAAAKLLPRGRAIGVDVWRADQTGNLPEVTRANATLEGVADRVEIHTADITDLSFDDNSVDVIVSSLVIHNVPGRAGREQAVAEAARVLRPGGRLAIADIGFTRQYARQLRELGWSDVRRRNLGWRMLWGPFLPTFLVTATKPG